MTGSDSVQGLVASLLRLPVHAGVPPASWRKLRRSALKKIFAVALLIASTAAFPVATPVFAGSSNDALCGPDAPEGYKRPGGYCEQIDNKNSLFDTDDEDCRYEVMKLISSLKPG